MSELKSAGKSFEISKWEVWEAWEKVKANKGAPGVDGCSIEVAIQLGARAGGSHAPVVKSSVSAWYLSLPHLVAVAR